MTEKSVGDVEISDAFVLHALTELKLYNLLHHLYTLYIHHNLNLYLVGFVVFVNLYNTLFYYFNLNQFTIYKLFSTKVKLIDRLEKYNKTLSNEWLSSLAT